MAQPTFYLLTALLLITVECSLAKPGTPRLYNARQDFVAALNTVRKEVGVGPVAWNTTLANYARQYAHRQAGRGCEFEHSNGPYGETLLMGYGSVTGGQAVRFWAGEKKHYSYASNKCVGGECRHYTQLVWRNSVRVGCARTRCSNGWMFVICNYDPSGNYEGERPY